MISNVSAHPQKASDKSHDLLLTMCFVIYGDY